jgi:hypothetical protein
VLVLPKNGTLLRLANMASIHTMFHDRQFRHSRNIKSITSTISEIPVLVLLTGAIYEARSFDGFMCHNIHAKIHEYW